MMIRRRNKKGKEDNEEESGMIWLWKLRPKFEESSEEESRIEEKLALNLASSDEESGESAVSEEEEEDVSQEEDEVMDEDDIPEEIANMEKETHRLAIVNMDRRYVTAKDLYIVLNSFLKKDGRVLSVAVYPTEFGLERMKHEEFHGPAIPIGGGDKKKEDEDAIDERILRSSIKLDLRFIPDSMDFIHPPRDIATEVAFAAALLSIFQALQMSKAIVSWDEDEPHRVKTLNQKFSPDQLADLEMKEFLASYESESDDDDDEKEKRKKAYRDLVESGDVESDEDEEEEENDLDMVVQFHTRLEDLSNKFREKKEEKSETVWDAQLRKMREKKRARRMKQKHDDDDNKKKEKGLEKKVAAEERRSIAELELIKV
ncbi:hypothetical protein DY000_02003483 [Brassica cretica]|uniref:ESF1 RRM domain-containing protein n=1 Tax=Brassica cretica TaxID=69181 RepID=A0ABQ7CGD7_BRACR|nr:hypothetical protein DY000_02003483 [Brassica cretica]